MDKGKKNSNSSILKKLEGYLSMKNGSRTMMLSKSKSWHSGSKAKSPLVLAPQACFYVYVGPEKEKFTIKAKYANHPLFKVLFEDAEMEYGYDIQGPILLPCDVDLFYKVLSQMDSEKEINGPRCGLAWILWDSHYTKNAQASIWILWDSHYTKNAQAQQL